MMKEKQDYSKWLKEDERVIAEMIGEKHALIYTNLNRLLVRGENSFGQLGLGDFKKREECVECFLHLKKDETITQLALGTYHSLFSTNQNRVFGTGFNYLGQLGLKDYTFRSQFVECPIALNENENIISIKAGLRDTRIETDLNRFFSCGNNKQQLTLERLTQKEQTIVEEVDMSSSCVDLGMIVL